MDTTATSTLAAYDRIIVVGEHLRSSVIPGSAQVFRFDEQMELGEEDLLKVCTSIYLVESCRPVNKIFLGVRPFPCVLGPSSLRPPVCGEEH